MRRSIIIATSVALFALAGVAFAAGSITSRDIKDSTITGKDVKNKSLTRKDFKGSVRGPRGDSGPQGARGAQGPQGPQGPAGPSALSTLTPVFGSVTIPAGGSDGGTVPCPSGQRVVSGGFFVDGNDAEVFESEANDARTGWAVAADNAGSATTADLEGVAYCAGAGQAVAARVTRKHLKPLTGRALRNFKAHAAKRGR
jgi:hypothetical protein